MANYYYDMMVREGADGIEFYPIGNPYVVIMSCTLSEMAKGVAVPKTEYRLWRHALNGEKEYFYSTVGGWSQNTEEQALLDKIDSGYEFTEQELDKLIWSRYRFDEYEGDENRWTRNIKTIVKIDKRYFAIRWECGLTEYQDNCDYQQPIEVELHEYTKTITVREWKEI